MRALSDLVLLLLLLLAGVAASVLGFWIGALSGLGKRLLILPSALLLLVPVYSGIAFVIGGPAAFNDFTWWFIGLTWVAGPWCIAVGLGYLFGSLRRRAKN